MLYAAKIAAARLYAPEHELDAIIAAIRAEEKEALRALKEREKMKAEGRWQKRLAWRFAERAANRNGTSTKPPRPPFLRRRRTRDRCHG
jgi:hypothetical protein